MSVSWADHEDFAHSLFAFVFGIGGDRAAALEIARESLRALEHKPEAAELERAKRYCFKEARRLTLKRFPPGAAAAARADATDEGNDTAVLAGLRALPEPERSAAFLFHVSGMESDDIARVLGIGKAELAFKLTAAREAVAAVVRGAGAGGGANGGGERRG